MKATRFLTNAARAVEKKGAGGINAVSLNAFTGGSASISVAIKAGSRYENSEGLAHFMCAARGTTSETHTQFLQQQQLGYAAAEFTCENTRDHLVYTLKAGPKMITELFNDVVLPAIFKNKYNQWELDNLERFLANQIKLPSREELMDNLHSVSFSGSLSNSKYLPAHRIIGGNIASSKTANDYYKFYAAIPEIGEKQRVQKSEIDAHLENHFKNGNISVMTTGMTESEQALCVANLVELSAPGGRSVAPSAKFVSGESRTKGKGKAEGMLGFPGAAAGSQNLGAYAAIASVFGGESFVYEGMGLLAIPTSDPKATLANLSSLSDGAIEMGIEQATADHRLESMTSAGAVKQALNGTTEFGTVTVAAVRQLAQSLAKGAKSLAIKGNLSNTPKLSEL